VGEIAPWDLRERLARYPDLLLLDVREPAEFAERARIEGELARLLKRINASLPRHEQPCFIAVAHEH